MVPEVKQPKLRTRSDFPSELLIDGVPIAIHVKRLTNDEYDAFCLGYDRWADPRGVPADETAEQKKAREADITAWMRTALAFLTIDAGEYEHDGQPVTAGEQLYDIFFAREDVVPQALSLVLIENKVAEAQKKIYRSALVSQLGWQSARLPAGTGDAPASAADAAAPSGSAPAGDATDAPCGVSSGTTDPTPATAAPASA